MLPTLWFHQSQSRLGSADSPRVGPCFKRRVEMKALQYPPTKKQMKMAETERRTKNQWLSSEPSSTVEINGHDLFIAEPMITRINGSEFCAPQRQKDNDACNLNLGIGEKTFSAAGAAFLSAIIVNPLDVVKTRLQAQAAGVPYSHPLSNLIGQMAYFGPNTMFVDLRCSPSCTRAGVHGTVAICPPDCFQYKGTLDVFNKIIRQEGFSRLWRGTNAGLALAVPTVGIYLPCYDIFRNWMEGLAAEHIPIVTPYVPLVAACATCYPIELARTCMQSQAVKDTQIQKKPPGVFSTLLGVLSNVKGTNPQNSCMLISTGPVSGIPICSNESHKWQFFADNYSLSPTYIQKKEVLTALGYRVLWTGMGAQLARDVPFSGICWSTLEPLRRRLLSLVGEESNIATILGANFSAGFVAGSLAASATCPLDIEVFVLQKLADEGPCEGIVNDNTTDADGSLESSRGVNKSSYMDGGMRGLFTGIGPCVSRAGPSVGIVISFYEVVKYVLQNHCATS
ncbi:hypothetical protein CXB51_019264 [Gossypium anomalum]|uniref:Mitochondrial carrier protein n=1 Tax=Gossypium anomalum TaxID=47600 RepID=A0A8J6CXI0_9ROSI|nr:hypothetical protein CXB51_019264 [Gossypium anomalum]